MGATAHDTSGPLAAFCSELARSGGRGSSLQPIKCAEEMVRALAVLARRYECDERMRQKANPIWIDADGEDRAAKLREAVAAWAQGDVPPAFRGQRLLALNWEAIMDGVDVQALNDQSASIHARYPSHYLAEEFARNSELEATFRRHMQEEEDWLRGNIAYQRLLAVLHALRDSHDIGAPAVLYIDHFHRLLGGGGERYPFNMAPVLKPLFARCQIQLWGACTFTEYQTTIERDAAMQRRLQEIVLQSARRC